MTIKIKKRVILALVLISYFQAFSQNQFVKSGSIGVTEKVKPTTKKLYGPVDFREHTEMVGEDFILMPRNKSIQSYGYQLITKENATSLMDHLSYNDYVGLKIKLVEFDGVHGVFQDSLGNRFKSTAYSGQFDSMASYRDLSEATKLLLHRSLWVKNPYLNTFNENTQETGSIQNVRLTRVTVEDIIASTDDQQPVRVVVKTSAGKYGFLDVNVSGSNQAHEYREFYSFNNNFWMQDPKVKYKYSPAIWKLIANRDVRIGMSKQQVKLSIGEPDDINYSEYKTGSHEQWIYGKDIDRDYYYFENGKLTSQN